jgi:isocitrate/isopropylmalate dehydrogenase
VIAVQKESVYRLVRSMFAEEFRKVAKEFPDCELDEVLVDGMA